MNADRMDLTSFLGLFFLLCVAGVVRHVFVVPAELRHLPRVSVLRLVWSYLVGEVEDQRLKKLILPFADKGDGVVLVWALGRWMVHILDPNLGRIMCDNIDQFPKESPRDDLILWKLIGDSNILISNGEQWKRHSRVIRGALGQSIPVNQFAMLSRRLFSVIGAQATVKFDDLAQRFALDAVGTTAFGHDFDAIRRENPFVRDYNGIMRGIANPLYLIMPMLERIAPRRSLTKTVDSLAERFEELLRQKREDPGVDMMTFMLKEVEMTQRELRDNMVLLFIAGHDTSAGGISTLVYYLARYPDMQRRAREEVLSILTNSSDPEVESLQRMHYLTACIREALRINTPISYIVPRAASRAVSLGDYIIPPKTSLIMNIYAIHHTESSWPDPFRFNPDRFLEIGDRKEGDKWLPFAMGPRQCPARKFALYEQLVLTALLLWEYEWTLPSSSIHSDGLRNAFSPFALSLPRDLEVCFSKRL